MYFIELLVKYFQKDKVENILKRYENERALNPLDEAFQSEDDSVECKHTFLPIDSTKMTFACSKCGLVIDKKALDNRNFFNDKKGLF